MAGQADSAAVERDLKAFPEKLAERLRAQLRTVAGDVENQARVDLAARTTGAKHGARHPPGSTAASLVRKVSVTATKATLKVAFAQAGPPYAAWVTYGLAPRPWRERAVSKKGYLSTRIGRAKIHKPWGIRARGFAQATQAAAVPMVEEAVVAAVSEAAQEFNGS